MDSHEGGSKATSHHNSLAPPNPPSIEAAYKRKCIELKKRLNEVEAANDAMRIRNAQGHRYIQKMRLESCMLLERLAVLTGMAEEQGVSTELRARTVALLKEMDPHYAPAANANRGGGRGEGSSVGVKRASYGIDYMDDGTEGSSEGHPPTPQERPLRVKRSRRADDSTSHLDTPDKDSDLMHSSTLPQLLPASRPRSPPSNHDMDSRIKPFNAASVPMSSSSAVDQYPHQTTLASSPTNRHRHHGGGNYAHGPSPGGSEQRHQQHSRHRYVSAFEDFTNRTRDKVLNDLVEAYGPETNITNEDIDRALADHWESLDPATKREYGDRRESRDGL
ncbi:hypothetical protein PAAG_00120 [Paracoccidioides lutzii Pb01]|uniref:HMG box domain-containing protein n=1 Tax=Paracoccidioides lutzii (strain ATCC MYA-826 / Pb01) TaxID=502779 RepID=C1GNM5_PARBA|nr:hypothetical protein PAAG_00120 [Paracoccidioides lutzii Pb01]EEH35797.2 hypothetical protein PAAG_00120 [Paracoccidioides lutzii Pb01]